MGAVAPALAFLAVSFAVAVACSDGDSSLSPAPEMAAAPAANMTGAPEARPTPTDRASVIVNVETITAGRALFTGGGGCSACHAIDDVAHGVLGPELNGIGTVATDRIAGYTAEQYLRESIVDSCAHTVEGTDCNLMLNVMNTVTLTDADVDALVAFLLQQR